MYPIDLSGKKGVVFGVANDRSIAWAISQLLAEAGAQLVLTYQNDRLKDRVARLADTLDNAIILPCDACDDAQIEAVFQEVGAAFGDISFLVHSIAFANREDLAGRFADTGPRGFPGSPGRQRLYTAPAGETRRPFDDRRRQRHRHDL